MSLETIVLIPAGMKPMHGGHIDLIKRYSDNPDVKWVKILIGPSKRDSIDQELSLSIAKFLTRNIEKTIIVETTHPTPVTSLYKYMETVTCGNFAVGASYKSNDYKTVTKFVENFGDGGKYHDSIPECVKAVELNLDFAPLLYSARSDDHNGIPISATIVRNDIENNDLKSFISNYPGVDIEDVVKVWNMIIAKTSKSTNLHMQHIEDLIFNDGLAGIIRCKDLMEKTLNTLTKEKEEVSISTKFDGSPAVFCWSSFPGLPDNGIALKGLFNSSPQTFVNTTDITESGKPLDLQRKLISLLSYLPNLHIPEGEIWQGDIMYNFESLTIEDINGYPALSFHPNAISYSPKSMTDYIRIKNSKLGLVWHTIYYGHSLSDIKCHYNVNVASLGHVPEIYMVDHNIRYEDLSPIELPASDTTYNPNTDYIGRLMELASDDTYLNIIENREFVVNLTLFYNSLIRDNVIVGTHKFVGTFKSYIKSRFLTIIESKKTQSKQIEYQNKCEALLDLIEKNRYVLSRMHHILLKITGLKIGFINELNKYSTFYTHFKMVGGKFNETNHEGYAINDGYNIVKLINRHEFSSSNFSDNVVKGWTK